MTRSVTKSILVFTVLSSFVMFAGQPSFAEDSPAAVPAAAAQPQKPPVSDPALDPAVVEKVAKYEKAAKKAFQVVKDIGQNLKQEDAKHFYMTYNNYNMIGTVKVVQKDVGSAIKACGENNPDMKPGLDTRYKTWDEAVAPVVKEAEANVNNMVMAQEYAPPEKVRDAFKALDEARHATNEQIDKKPVTTADACEHLLDKMDDTQENLVSLLRTTLVSFGRAYPETGKEPAAGDDKPAGDTPGPEKAPPLAEEKKL